MDLKSFGLLLLQNDWPLASEAPKDSFSWSAFPWIPRFKVGIYAQQVQEETKQAKKRKVAVPKDDGRLDDSDDRDGQAKHLISPVTSAPYVFAFSRECEHTSENTCFFHNRNYFQIVSGGGCPQDSQGATVQLVNFRRFLHELLKFVKGQVQCSFFESQEKA